ncbi:MAG: sensor histidine kinase [Pseudomonadota bacterium]
MHGSKPHLGSLTHKHVVAASEALQDSGILRRFRRLSLLKKTLVANFAVVLVGAVAGTFLTRALADRHSGWILAVVFSSCGAVITFLVNYLAFWDHFRPLVELSRALDAIRSGQQGRNAIEGVRASGFSGVLDSVRTLLERIEDDSLQFSARLLGSIETERQRIGRELHDDTSQILAAALLKLDLAQRNLPAETTAARGALASVRDLLERTLDQLKAVIYDLRPAILDDLGLTAALNWYVKARVEQAELEIVVHLPEGAPRLAPQVETALYRIGQEAIANAVKHADAARLELGLEIKPGYAALTVFDDGRGFELPAARGRGLGLLSMQERAALLGGTFNIVTEPGLGTRVYAVVPLEESPSITKESET